MSRKCRWCGPGPAPHLRDERGAVYAELAIAAADHGEPWLGYFTPDELSTLLTEYGFTVLEHISQRDAVASALWQRSDSLRPADLCRLVCAVVR